MNTMPTISHELLHLVRLGFFSQRSSLNAWCKSNGITRQYATQSLLGKRPKGKAEKALRMRIWQASQQETNHE